ncbi:MAG: hypothetical protein R2912_08595 [Eubacteriales bacterium]
MNTEIIILSGFLGAGKPHCFRDGSKRACFTGKLPWWKTTFGEVGMHAELLRSGNISVTELQRGLHLLQSLRQLCACWRS